MKEIKKEANSEKLILISEPRIVLRQERQDIIIFRTFERTFGKPPVAVIKCINLTNASCMKNESDLKKFTSKESGTSHSKNNVLLYLSFKEAQPDFL